MSGSSNEISALNSAAKDLEPYRRLVDLQKQMIELSQQHEQAKRRRDDLHKQMAREAADWRPLRRGLRHRLQRSAARFLKRVSGAGMQKTNPESFNHKQPS